MSDELPPDWAIDRARALTLTEPGAEDEGYSVSIVKRDYIGFPTTIAFARYIAEHEDAPVDPLLIEAREVVAAWFDENPGRFRAMSGKSIRSGEHDKDPTITQAIACLRRGIELGKSS